MKMRFLAVAWCAVATPLFAEPVDMTGMSCSHATSYAGQMTWEFHGDRAVRYFDDGSVSSLRRVGVGSYERYDRSGEWAAIYLFYDTGDGVHLRTLSRPGLIVREQNRATPLDRGVTAFNADCAPIWERP